MACSEIKLFGVKRIIVIARSTVNPVGDRRTSTAIVRNYAMFLNASLPLSRGGQDHSPSEKVHKLSARDLKNWKAKFKDRIRDVQYPKMIEDIFPWTKLIL